MLLCDFWVWIEDYVSGFGWGGAGWLCGVVWRLLISEFPATLGWSAHRSIWLNFARALVVGQVRNPMLGFDAQGTYPPALLDRSVDSVQNSMAELCSPLVLGFFSHSFFLFTSLHPPISLHSLDSPSIGTT